MKTIFAFIFMGLLILGTDAQAKPKFMGLIWWPSHWRDQDFQPYYETAVEPHNTQWDNQELSDKFWTPVDWANNGGGSNKLIRQWYATGILNDQSVCNGVPYVEVGPNFYHLGGADKRRVMETVDAIYGVTKSTPKMFYLRDYRTDRVIGEYSQSGLVLQ